MNRIPPNMSCRQQRHNKDRKCFAKLKASIYQTWLAECIPKQNTPSEARPAMNSGPGKPPPVQDAGSSQACKRAFLKSKPLLSRRGLGWLAISMTARRLFKVRVYKHSATTKQPLKVHTTKKVRPFDLTLKRRLPTLPRDNRSTIGVSELNFSVRNGKRWNLTAITT